MEANFRICKDYMVYPKKNLQILFKNPVFPKIWCNIICGTQCKDWGRRKKFTPYTSHSCRLSTLYMHSRMCQYSFGTYFEIPCIGYILKIKGLYEKGMGGCRCEVLGAPTPARRQIICDVTSDVTQSNWGGAGKLRSVSSSQPCTDSIQVRSLMGCICPSTKFLVRKVWGPHATHNARLHTLWWLQWGLYAALQSHRACRLKLILVTLIRLN